MWNLMLKVKPNARNARSVISRHLQQVAAVEEILNGGEGNKFKATAEIVLNVKKSFDKDGKISSTACSVQ